MHKKARAAILLGGIFIFAAQVLSAQPVESEQPAKRNEIGHSQARIERLAGLGRIWGAVRYFHPALAIKPVDWDKALVEAIPRVDAAKTQDEYIAAINGMLAVLGDPATRARPAGAANKTQDEASPPPKDAEPIQLDAGKVLRVDVPLAARMLIADNSLARGLVATLGKLTPQARAAVIDLRRPSPADGYFDDYAEQMVLAGTLNRLVEGAVMLPTARYRMHKGYAPQNGRTESGYASMLVTQAPSQLSGWRKGKSLPIVFLVNRFSGEVGQARARGLRSAGLAYVVQEGGIAPAANDIRTLQPAPGIELDISVSQQVAADGSTAFVADRIVQPGQTVAVTRQALQQSFPRNVSAQSAKAVVPRTEIDRPYADMAYPARAYRLLALFRYWNVIEYFYPYKNLIGSDWDEVLTRYIPRFEADADAVAYQRTLAELSTEIHDSHGSVHGTVALDEQLGQYVPPLRVRLIEGQTVVTKLLASELPARVGDVVLAVDGKPVEQLRKERARLTPASTPQALQRVVHEKLLRGAKDSQVRLRIRGHDGGIREVAIPRSLAMRAKAYASGDERSGPVVDVLPGGIGYVDLDRLPMSQVDAMFERLHKAPAIIFDLRGYPKGTGFRIAPRLGTKQQPVLALGFYPIVEAVALGSEDFIDWAHHQVEQHLPEATGERYTGKVVMLIDETAQSQSEHTGLAFEAATPTTFVGSPTAGADGDVTQVVVPGGIFLSFSGYNVRHADGRQLQRLGLQPDIHVEPTIAGIAASRDEVLEAALAFLRGEKPKPQ